MIWIYTDFDGRVLACNQSDMGGNTDWVRYDGEPPSMPLTDEHGAAKYKLLGGVISESTPEERMGDWEPEPEPEATVDDYREMLRELGVDV